MGTNAQQRIVLDPREVRYRRYARRMKRIDPNWGKGESERRYVEARFASALAAKPRPSLDAYAFDAYAQRLRERLTGIYG